LIDCKLARWRKERELGLESEALVIKTAALQGMPQHPAAASDAPNERIANAGDQLVDR
jgi:hypothetical protein